MLQAIAARVQKPAQYMYERTMQAQGSERPGASMDGKSWPHGWRGDAYPHGTVFSR